MKTFLMAAPEETFAKDLFSILGSKYNDLHIQTATTNGEVASMLLADKFDLAIVNSDADALSLSLEIIAAGSSMPILVYTENNYIPFIKQLYNVGVSGVINVSDDDAELLRAVADVLAKKIYISESVKQQLLESTLTYNLQINELEENLSAQYPIDFTTVVNNYAVTTFIGNENIPFFTVCLN